MQTTCRPDTAAAHQPFRGEQMAFQGDVRYNRPDSIQPLNVLVFLFFMCRCGRLHIFLGCLLKWWLWHWSYLSYYFPLPSFSRSSLLYHRVTWLPLSSSIVKFQTTVFTLLASLKESPPPTHTHTHIHPYKHTHTHIHTYAHTKTHTPVLEYLSYHLC